MTQKQQVLLWCAQCWAQTISRQEKRHCGFLWAHTGKAHPSRRHPLTYQVRGTDYKHLSKDDFPNPLQRILW